MLAIALGLILAVPALGAERCVPGPGATPEAGFDGVQIEAADLPLHELFFEQILHATVVQRLDHPQIDRIRGYCYRGLLIVVRQDVKSPRPTGWVQVNFSVPNVAAIQAELEKALQASPVSGRPDADKVVRIRLKPDVSRGGCRAARLEVGGPEGFMVGFNQYKEGSCHSRD